MVQLKSKYKGKCSATGYTIQIGDLIVFDTRTKKVYCKLSQEYRAHLKDQITIQINQQSIQRK